MTPNPDRRNLVRLSLLAAVAANSLSLRSACANNPGLLESAAAPDPSVHDFDLFFGTWRARHRRLKERLADNTEWTEFDGTSTMHRLLGGYGNLDDNVFYLPGGTYRGVSLRAFDPGSKRWAIWWLDGRAPHTLDAPVIGRFENGVGTFVGDDTLRGKPIKVRYQWSRITSTSRQWEQAFSPDGGKNWETNWITQFTRTGPSHAEETVAAAPGCFRLVL